MPLSDVLHQDVAQDRLRRALSSRRVPHAYLFTGPSGVGKEMLATGLAQLLLCGRREASDEGGLIAAPTSTPPSTLMDACGECEDCILFAAGTHPDYHRIHRMLAKMHLEKKVRDRKATILSVDVIRQFVIGQIGLCASRGRAKVFVMVESERMNDEAQNALLKTLEEPPGHSYIILLATAPDELLPTTRSRCQQIAFGTLPDSFIAEQLVSRRGVSAEAAAFLTQLAQGSLGQALRYAEMGMFDRLGVVAAAMRTAPDDPLACGKSLADLAKSLSSDAEDVQSEEEGDINAAREAQTLVIAMASTLLRDIQRAAVGSAPLARPHDALIAQLAPRTTTRRIGRAISALGTAEYQIERNANTGLIFDGVGIALGGAFTSPGHPSRRMHPTAR